MLKFSLKIIQLLIFTTYAYSSLSTTNDCTEIYGNLKGDYQGYIYLITYLSNKRVVDSSLVTKGSFYFKKDSIGLFTDFAFLKLDANQYKNSDSLNAVQIQLDNSKINISIELNHFSKYIITGCKSCNELMKYNQKLENKFKYDYYYNLYEVEKNEIKKAEFDKKLDSINGQIIKYDKHYICEHPNANLAPYLLNKDTYQLKLAETQYLFHCLSLSQRRSYFGEQVNKFIKEEIAIKKQLKSKCENFTIIDIHGNKTSLNKIGNNKFVIIDFWGSWCMPCRREFPELLALYNKYKEKGLEILGIATQKKEKIEDWKKAIEVDSISVWYHALSENIKSKDGFSNFSIKNYFHVDAFPTLILLDKDKIIVGRYGPDSLLELEKILAEQLN